MSDDGEAVATQAVAPAGTVSGALVAPDPDPGIYGDEQPEEVDVPLDTPYVYALGRVEPRFPSVGVEKEFAQATGRAQAAGLTDRQAIQELLADPLEPLPRAHAVLGADRRGPPERTCSRPATRAIWSC